MTVEQEQVKEELFWLLDRFPHRSGTLLTAIREGRIDGSVYQGRCRCIYGWAVPGTGVHTVAVDFAYGTRIVERCYLEDYVDAVVPGDVPETCPVLRDIEAWIIEWRAK